MSVLFPLIFSSHISFYPLFLPCHISCYPCSTFYSPCVWFSSFMHSSYPLHHPPFLSSLFSLFISFIYSCFPFSPPLIYFPSIFLRPPISSIHSYFFDISLISSLHFYHLPIFPLHHFQILPFLSHPFKHSHLFLSYALLPLTFLFYSLHSFVLSLSLLWIPLTFPFHSQNFPFTLPISLFPFSS